MKRITVPEPKIDLYKQGFEAAPGIDRKTDGDKLSDLVERIEEPIVIALDAPWGAGKTTFLKCWVGEHIKPEHNHSATTVYFDAFKMDFLDDPLIALTREITRQFEKDENYTPEERVERSKKLQRAAWAIGKGVARIGLSAATFGATEILNNVGDEIAKAAGREAEAFLNSEQGEDCVNDFWSTQNAKIAAMDAFGLALADLTEPGKEDGAARKLVIVVDELDRCRPDYALSLLEVTKHFFNVPNVHFVLGVNLSELKNSVRVRYGPGIQADKYLQKFYNVRAYLSLKTATRYQSGVLRDYFQYQAGELGLRDEKYLFALQVYFDGFQHIPEFSLRDANHIITEALLSPNANLQDDSLRWYLSAGLIALKVISPETLLDMRSPTWSKGKTGDEILSIFGFDKIPDPTKFPELQNVMAAWRWATRDPNDSGGGLKNAALTAGITKLTRKIPSNRNEYLTELMKASVDTFDFVPGS